MEYIEKVRKLNKNKKLKYHISTMGCQLNENDSEKLCGMLEEMNYEKTEDIKKADIVLFNTCCVRENAEEKLFGKLRRTKKIKARKRFSNCYWWLYDARGTYYKKNKIKLSICRHFIWNSYLAQISRRLVLRIRNKEKIRRYY